MFKVGQVYFKHSYWRVVAIVGDKAYLVNCMTPFTPYDNNFVLVFDDLTGHCISHFAQKPSLEEDLTLTPEDIYGPKE